MLRDARVGVLCGVVAFGCSSVTIREIPEDAGDDPGAGSAALDGGTGGMGAGTSGAGAAPRDDAGRGMTAHDAELLDADAAVHDGGSDADAPADALPADASGDGAPFDTAVCVVPVELTDMGPGVGPGDAGVCEPSLCRTPDGYEIRLTHPAGFYVGALFWVLVACDRELLYMHYPNGVLATIAFPLSEQELSGIADGAPLGVFYGSTPVDTPPGHTGYYRGFNCGVLDKGAVADCP